MGKEMSRRVRHVGAPYTPMGRLLSQAPGVGKWGW
jgi:hypothetical protein